ncbi:hypothetical protein [Bacillus sp. FJAT-27986]|uniref:hypothetical protein n=1 Tax=Bacillus sp. FJAT-27986 TaxID=1743146 RepID=UPI00080ACF47|nr:hypothetical protein [Bacillus sp. FJAT-27986]OCA86562.1 hypothetical protein A8L44_09200 [Bacillus sp. FJAT-27986]
MDNVFSQEMNEIFKEFEKKSDREKIKKALLAGELKEAGILFKYSCLTEDEFEEIEIELLIETRADMVNWENGKELARKAKAILKEKANKKDQQ